MPATDFWAKWDAKLVTLWEVELYLTIQTNQLVVIVGLPGRDPLRLQNVNKEGEEKSITGIFRVLRYSDSRDGRIEPLTALQDKFVEAGIGSLTEWGGLN